jgi:hypothetical protein
MDSTTATTVIAVSTLIYGLATLIYGGATIALWRENRADRVQRNKHRDEDTADRKLRDLHSAFYAAWGNWAAKKIADRPSEHVSQTATTFEAFMRLEGELRLNGHKTEADNLGYALRKKQDTVDERLADVGIALGLVVPAY